MPRPLPAARPRRTLAGGAASLTLALLLAVGLAACTKEKQDAAGNTTASTTKGASKLGLEEKVACIVHGEEIRSKDVDARVDGIRDLGDDLDPEVDFDELDIDHYEGDVPDLSAYVLDRLIMRAIVEHAAGEDDVEVSGDDVDEEIASIADDDFDEDEGDLFDAFEDAYGYSRDETRAAIRDAMLRDELADHVEDELSDEFDDVDEFVEDARGDAQEDVDCGDDFTWEDDLDYSLDVPEYEGDTPSAGGGSDADGSEGKDGSGSDEEAEGAEEEQEDPAIAAGAAYDRDASTALRSYSVILRRFSRVWTKLNSGQISAFSAVDGMERQEKAMRGTLRKIRRVRTSDPYLRRNHRRLVKCAETYHSALVALAAMDDQTSGAAVTRKFNEAQRLLTRSGRELKAWETGLGKDPKGRSFPLIERRLARTIEMMDEIN